MSAIAFGPSESRLHSILSDPYTMPPVPSSMGLEAMTSERRMSTAQEGAMALPTVLLRRLPRNTTAEAVRTMLLFAKDLQETEIIPNEYDEDAGFATAIARFASMTGASEAQAMLDGKSNTAGQAKMIVNVISSPSMAARRNTIDPMAGRRMAQSVSPTQTNATKSSRFNGTFQSMDKTSPPMGSPPDFPSSDTSSQLQTIFSPQLSGTSVVTDRSRNSGKTVIDEGGGDDDTGELLKDPLAYMNNSSAGNAGRKHTNSRVPTAAFSSLSLNTNMGVGPSHAYASPRSAAQSRTPHSQFSPSMGANGQYSSPSQPFVRHNFPPANPADQNPPCNTLYVGNLPIDTSEDELKAMFSKQRGYKRLCFRTKQNGPMCFVEFEDVSFATKALNDLYGAQLHNSVKGGIRLSFSKNPLGVRSGQAVSVNPTTPLSATGAMSMSGFGSMTPGAFSTAAGPPPGLSAPPGLNMSMPPGVNGVVPPSAYAPQGYAVGNGALPNMRAVAMNTGPANQNIGSGYPDYMLGR